MEMDRTHLAKTTCQHDKASIAVESTGGAKKRKTKRDMEEMAMMWPPAPPQRGPGIAGGATGATVPPTAALAAAFCFSIVQSNV